jgi:hypothetical protein
MREKQQELKRKLRGRRVRNVVVLEDGVEIQFGNKKKLTIKHRAVPNPLEGGTHEWTSFLLDDKEVLRR